VVSLCEGTNDKERRGDGIAREQGFVIFVTQGLVATIHMNSLSILIDPVAVA
jgi:hypothetical protein